MYPSINICNNNSNNNNFIYNNTPIPTSPIQYEDEHVLLQHIHSLLLQQEEQQHNNFDIVTGPVTESPITKPASSPVAPKGCKKDRHSKIHTAHGPRDRRMRLSLDVARKFFDLQDMLGFDKASKTVDWLMMKSRVAINELKNQGGGGSTLSSTTSECEAVSGVVDQEFEPPMGMDNSNNNNNNNNNNVKLCEKKAKGPGRVRPALFNPLAKESRNKARERARERTQMKKNLLGETRAEARPKAGACLPENSDHADATAVAKELTTSSSHIHEHSWSGGLSTIFHSHENEFGYYTYSGKYWEGYSNGN